ncbi:Os07g0582050 [Oryza sativa Japonica Group]|uniref:Os07g0582050 protein n=1 Tax=Oryza sativa subsp. japonica TaxID=39947 RepID=A0A0P0X7T1_ORYSJ|nr:Os07g0582050 [Oryza sativa Japonica Group]
MDPDNTMLDLKYASSTRFGSMGMGSPNLVKGARKKAKPIMEQRKKTYGSSCWSWVIFVAIRCLSTLHFIVFECNSIRLNATLAYDVNCFIKGVSRALRPPS